MQLLIEDSEKRAYESVWSDRQLRLPSFEVGAVPPFSIGVMRRIRLPWDARLFTPIDLADWTIQAAIGGGFVLPVAGTFQLTWSAESALNISFNPTSGELSDALNALETITAAGGVTVQGSAGFFTITFNEAGARALITADASMLTPRSLIDIQEVVTGDADTSEVQTLRITQNVGALATLSTDSAAASASVEQVQLGDATHNHKVRVTLPDNRYGGTWTYTSASVESGPIGYDDSPAQIKRVLEAITSVGTGNVSVEQETEHEFLITYIGTKALTAIASVAVNGANLRVVGTKSGSLDLRGPGVEVLLNGEASTVVSLEIEGTPATGLPQKLLKQAVLLTRPVIERASFVPNNAVFIQTDPFTQLTGGTGAALDSVATADLDTERWLAKVVRDVSGTYSASEWFLISGTTAEDAENGVVRPDDYDTDDPKVWVRVSGF